MGEINGTSTPFDFEQGSVEWLRARAGKLSASRFPALMKVLKSGKPAQSYLDVVTDAAVERMTGSKMETHSTYWMSRGIELEPDARRAYEDHEMVVVDEIPIVIHPEYDFISASPDGLVGKSGLAEFKCPTAANHANALLTGKHAIDYYWQAVGQMLCTGRSWCDLVSFHPEFPEGLQLAIKRIERDEGDIERLLDTCMAANKDADDLVTRMVELGT